MTAVMIPESEYVESRNEALGRRPTVIEVYPPPSSISTYRRRTYFLPKQIVASFARKLANALRDDVGWIITVDSHSVLITQRELENSMMLMRRIKEKDYNTVMNWLHAMRGVFSHLQENQEDLGTIYSTLNPYGSLDKKQLKVARKVYRKFSTTPIFLNGEPTRLYMLLARILSNIIISSPQSETWRAILKTEYAKNDQR